MPKPNRGPQIRFLERRGYYYIVWYENGAERLRGTGTADLHEAQACLEWFKRDPEAYAERYADLFAGPRKMEKGLNGHVYFVGCPAIHMVKIGVALDLAKRVIQLQCGSPVELTLLASTPGSQRLERQYHVRFASARRHGEWFFITDEIAAEIKALNRQARAA